MILSAFIVWSIAVLRDVPVKADNTTIEVGDTSYLISTYRGTWEEAKTFCSRLDGHLASVTSEEAYIALTSELWSFSPFRNGCYWIGATDTEKEGDWKWIDGSSVGFTDWNPDVFDFLTKYLFNCAAVCLDSAHSRTWRWAAKSCTFEWRVVCEIEVVRSTEDPRVRAVTTRQNGVRQGHRKPPTSDHRAVVIVRVAALPNHLLLSKPDMVRKVTLITACARICRSTLDPCLILNFNRKTRTCRGFSKRTALQNYKSVASWEVWETQRTGFD